MPSKRTGKIDRHGRRWRLQVKVHGERIRQSFDTREEAESALAAILADVERDAAADLARRLGRLTVADLVRLYYERRKPDLEASTCARYENVMEKYILPGFGHHDVGDVVATPMILVRWRATSATPYRSSRWTCTPTTWSRRPSSTSPAPPSVEGRHGSVKAGADAVRWSSSADTLDDHHSGGGSRLAS